MDIFSKRLHELRKENRISQEELAAAIGTTKSTISKYEHGTIEPTLSVIKKLADYFSVTTDYLLCQSDVSEVGSDLGNEYIRAVVSAKKNGISADKIMDFIRIITDKEK